MFTMFNIKGLSITALLIAASASAGAAQTVTKVSVFATGTAPGVNGTQPDSITVGDGSVWVEYGNGADSTGLSGSSTIVRYDFNGTVQDVFSIAGLVDGLKVNPVTGMVWALQNNDGNSMLSLINPTTNIVSAPLSYAVTSSSRGYDDVAFLDNKVYLSYSNPVNPGDPVVQSLDQGNTPTGTLTTTEVITALDTNPAFTDSSLPPPDIDSLKSTPNGDLVLTSEGDSPGMGLPPPPSTAGEYTLIANPGTPKQTVTNVLVNNAGVNVFGMDDVIFPGATSGWLYVASTGSNAVYRLWLTGLDPNAPIISIGGLDEVAVVNPTTGNVETALLTGARGLMSPHGMDFVAAPEPSTWAMILLGFAGLGFVGRRASGRRAAAAG
jgi:hypothetical protein